MTLRDTVLGAFEAHDVVVGMGSCGFFMLPAERHAHTLVPDMVHCIISSPTIPCLQYKLMKVSL